MNESTCREKLPIASPIPDMLFICLKFCYILFYNTLTLCFVMIFLPWVYTHGYKYYAPMELFNHSILCLKPIITRPFGRVSSHECIPLWTQ